TGSPAEQLPLAGSQVPAVWQAFDGVHTLGVPDWHTPLWQASPLVQALLSSQVVPFGAGGLEHWPVAGSQVPTRWQASAAGQVAGVPGVHWPALHTSRPLQASLSEHDVPSETGVCVQVPSGAQASAVQGLPSSQLGPTLVHMPLLHWPAAPHPLAG